MIDLLQISLAINTLSGIVIEVGWYIGFLPVFDTRQNIASSRILFVPHEVGSGATENTGWTSFMKSSRSRSRNKSRSNTRPTGGNIVNRVFDSSGPEGKVRGTPQQIVEKYTQLHRDSLLARDSVNSENFAQHAEHYTRLLAEAQKEIDAKREEQEKYNRERQIEQDKQNRERQAERDRERDARIKAQELAAVVAPAPIQQPVQIEDGDSGLVETPEEAPKLVEVPKVVEAHKLVKAPTVVEAPKVVEAPRVVEAPKAVEAPKVVEAPKKRRTRKPKTRPDQPPEGSPTSEAGD